MKPEPFRIAPNFVPRIWGARSLAPFYPEKTNLSEPTGEVWLTGVDCKVASGPFAGKTLGEAWREMPSAWRGARFTEPGDFPILVKLIFPKDRLSVQVHPDDGYAASHEQAAGGRGKTEMWHAVLADPGAHVFVGTKPGVSQQLFLDAITHNTVENLLERYSVLSGDTFFVPAGTPHTIGPGMILCEVQEYSDLTYRVYDYGRTDARGKPREMHVEKALDVIQFGKTAGGKVASLPLFSGSHRKEGKRTLLCACRYFAVERWEFHKGMGGTALRRGFSFDILVVLSGKGQIGWRNNAPVARQERRKGSHVDFQAGQCWFIPAGLTTAPRTALQAAMLRAYVPNLEAVRSELKVAHQPEAAIAQTVFG